MIPIVFIIIGIIVIYGAVCNRKWLYNNKLFGLEIINSYNKDIAQKIYFRIGVILIGIGILYIVVFNYFWHWYGLQEYLP
ncbi:hypothetical protein [Capnocytophaga canimorsus]|uniref:hypothetical protein n=1 Tax=Capnocytophaga canimorsus TaxID=28188 RepID=UPI0028E9C91E|nr:hypothetical protein [Capnocytophaga canimorsus]